MLASLACGSGSSSLDETHTEVTAADNKVLFVIANKDFRDEELTTPRKILEDAGFEAAIASTDTSAAKGMLGLKVKPDILIADAAAADYKALIIVGGAGSKVLWNNENLIGLARKFSKQDKVLGAICLAPIVLANAGLLTGVDATCFSGVSKDLEEGGANYVDRDVVVSGKIVTAAGPAAAEGFGKKLLALLTENDEGRN